MELADQVESLDAVPEPFRRFYTEAEGGFALDSDGFTGAVKNYDSLLDEKKKLAKRIRDLEGRKYLSPEEEKEIQALRAEAEKRAQETAEKKGEWDKLRDQINAKHQQEIEAERKQAERLRTALESNLIDAEATRAIAAAKGAPELLLPHVQRQTKVVEEDGQYVVRVIDPRNGEPRIGDSSGNPMTIQQLVAEMRESQVFGRAFDAATNGGSGAPAEAGGSGGAGMPKHRGDFNSTAEKSAFIDKHGVEKFKALPAPPTP